MFSDVHNLLVVSDVPKVVDIENLAGNRDLEQGQ